MNNMNNSIKRAQSRAGSSFAERKNFRLQAKHRILSLLVLLLTAVTGAWADEPTSGTCGENVTWAVTGSENNYTLTIGGTGAMNDYDYTTHTNRPWKSFGTQIKNLVIEDGVTHIGDFAFLYMEGITTSVVIPGSVESVGSHSFIETNLTSVTFSPGVKSIGKYAFTNITSLTNVTFGEGLETIYESAFEGCTGLQTVEFPASIDFIDKNAFLSSSNIESYTFNGGVPRAVNTTAFSNSKEGCIVRVPMYSTGWDSDGNGIWDRKGTSYGLKIETFASSTPFPSGTDNEWVIASMPAYNVVLTPRYASATIYQKSGETLTEKKAYETLKEAIQNVQDGETIKLDWDVTVSEPLTTPNRGDNDPISFTLDLNGYILDAETTVEHVIKLNNGDELTISNIRDDKLGGIKGNIFATNGSHIVFDGGRYFFNASSTAEAIQQGWSDAVQNYGWQMAEGKEFVNLEGGADANDGFLVRVDYVPFELTIGPKRFATFYDTHNITMIEGNQNISFYTIKKGDIDLDNNVAKVTKVENAIIPAGLPLLVYNGGEQQQTVKLKVTTAEATPIENIANEFVGTLNGREFDDDVMAAADYYALSGGKMFVPVYETGTIAPHKCWLQFNKNDQQQGARSIMLVFGETTGVNEVIEVNEVSDDTLYDLNGRKLNAKPTRKGVYINDGRKKVVR